LAPRVSPCRRGARRAWNPKTGLFALRYEWRSKRFNTGDPPRHLFFVIFCAVAAAMPVIVPVGRAIVPNAT
jgi:hypothetical protein